MSYQTELQTYIGTLNTTANNLGTLGAKLKQMGDAAETAAEVVSTIDDIGEAAGIARKAIDSELAVLKVTKLAGPLSRPSALYEDVLKKVRPVVEKIEKAVETLNGKIDEKDGGGSLNLLDQLENQLNSIKSNLQNTGNDLTEKALQLLESQATMSGFLDALDHADFADYDGLKSSVEAQFNGRNLVTAPLGETFNDIVSSVNGFLDIFAKAKFEPIQEDFGNFQEMADIMESIAEPLNVVAAVLAPVEGLLSAAGGFVDLILGPIFSFITETLGIDDLLNDIADDITGLLPGGNALNPLIEQAQAFLDNVRDFNVTAFGIDDFNLDIDERLYGATVGNALLGPTGIGTEFSEVLTGDSGDDILDGKGGNDNIYGQGGNDIFVASEGDDYLYGGDGEDMVFFGGYLNEYEFAKEGTSGKIIVTHVRPPSGTQNEGSTRLDSVENVVFRNISFKLVDLENAIIGGSTLNGTNGDDLMFLNSTGTPNADGQHVANGLGGDDRIFGSTDRDELNGGTGNDILIPQLGDDEVNGGDGTDTYQVLDSGRNNVNRIDLLTGEAFGHEGREILTGIENIIIQHGGGHILKGSNGDNNILSGRDGQIIGGRGGNDFINAGEGNDIIVAGDGLDTVLAGTGDDIVVAAQAAGIIGSETYDAGGGFDSLFYSTSGITELRNIDVSIGPDVSSLTNEIASSDTWVRIMARTGRIERYDAAGTLLGVDEAIGFDQIGGSNNDDIIFGAPRDDYGLTIFGAGGNDTMYTGGAREVMGGDGDDRIIATLSAEGRAGAIVDGGQGDDVLDLRNLGPADVRIRFEDSIASSLGISGTSAQGKLKPGQGAGFNVYGVETFLLMDGQHDIYNRAGGTFLRTFKTGEGNDKIHHAGGIMDLYAGGGDDRAVFDAEGRFFGGAGNDYAEFDTYGATEYYGGTGNDTLLVNRLEGTADGGAGFDRIAFDLEPGIAVTSGQVTVDLAAGTALMTYFHTSRGNQTDVDATITSFEEVIASGFDDYLYGADANERFVGRGGDDSINGRGGDDQIFGGAGNDVLYGDIGDDRIHGGAGDDVIYGAEGNDTVVYTYAAPDGVDGKLTAGNFGGVTVDLVANTATGSFGNDTLGSIENVFGSGGNDTLLGNDERNVLAGEAGNDILAGRGGNDLLVSGGGTDNLDGGIGNDDMVVNAGVKTVIGGKGFDRLVFGGEAGSIAVNFATKSYAGTLKVATPVWLDTGTKEARDFNGALLTPLDVKETLANFANSADDLTRVVPAGDHPLAGMFRITDRDQLLAASGDWAGVEALVGGGSTLMLRLSNGVDRFNGTNSTHDLVDFRDAVRDVTFNVGTGVSNLSRTAGDTLIGIDGAHGGSHDDTFTGNGGANFLYGQAGDDTLSGGNARDLLRGGLGNDTLNGGAHRDRLFGEKGSDTMLGGGGNDLLNGGGARDVIKGGNGRDVVIGGAGNDALFGGKGVDTFRFVKGFDQDTVRDFRDDVDRIDFRSFDFANRAEAMSHARNTAAGHVAFDFGNGDVLVVQDITKAALGDDLML